MRASQEGLANRFFGVVWIEWLVATALRIRRLGRPEEQGTMMAPPAAQ